MFSITVKLVIILVSITTQHIVILISNIELSRNNFWWLLWIWCPWYMYAKCIVIMCPMINHKYTARQLYRIAPLVATFCLVACGKLCQCQYKALGDIKTNSPDPLTNLYGLPVSILSREYWFLQLPQRQYDAFVSITFSCEPSLYENYHLQLNWQSRQPISGL